MTINKFNLLSCTASAAVSAFFWTAPADAQEAAPQPPSTNQAPSANESAPRSSDPAATPTKEDQGIEEIIVTAQRRAENLQRTALAVTAVSPDQIARQGLKSTSDLQGLAPGVIFVSDRQIAVRGITNNTVQNQTVATDLSVSVFVDGLINPRSQPGLLYDVNRVEVLRGPQGTLYGRNNTAGALNIYHNLPTDVFEGRASLEVGTYARLSTEGMINVPLNDQIALRGAFMTVRHNEYQDNGYGTQDDVAGRVQLSVKPSSAVRLLLGLDYEHNAGIPYSPVLFPPGSVNPGNEPWEPWEGQPVCPNGIFVAFRACAVENPKTSNTTKGVSAQLDWDLGFADLVYLGGYKTQKLDQYGFGFSNYQFWQEASDKWQSHELRLASLAESPIKWVAGLYYFREKADFIGIINPSPTGAPFGRPFGHTESGPGTSRSMAAFAQATVPIIDRFRVTAGIRYTDDRKRAEQRIYDTAVRDAPAPANTPVINSKYDKSNVSYKIGAEFDISPTVLTYVDYSTGYKAGGFNIAANPGSFRPETIKAIQGGIKSRLFDNHVQLNVDAFHYNYEDFQISALLFGVQATPGGPPTIAAVTINAPKTKSYGLEAESIVQLSADDRLQGNVSWMAHNEFEDFTIPPPVLVSPNVLDGFRVPYSPKWSGRVQYGHTFRFDTGAKIEAQIHEDFNSGYWIQIQHLPGSKQKSFHRTGFDFTYFAPRSQWSLGVWARNLENKATLNTYYFPRRFPPTPGAPVPITGVDISGQPRTFGLRLSANF